MDAAHILAGLSYTPGALTGVRTLLVLSSDPKSGRGWSKLISPAVEQVMVPAPHDELLRERGRAQTVQVINAWLSSATETKPPQAS